MLPVKKEGCIDEFMISIDMAEEVRIGGSSSSGISSMSCWRGVDGDELEADVNAVETLLRAVL
jgi:hypothetical protein